MPFEYFLPSVSASVGRRRVFSYGLAFGFHALLVAFFLVRGVWNVGELTMPEIPVHLSWLYPVVAPPPPRPPAPPKAPRPPAVRRPVAAPPLDADPTTATQPSGQAPAATPTRSETNNALNDTKVGGCPEGTPCPTGEAHPDPGTGTGPPILSPTVAQQRCVACPVPRIPPSFIAIVGHASLLAKLCVNANGVVTSVSVVTGISPTIDQTVTNTLAAWRYTPYTVAGNPVPFCYLTRFTFTTK